MNIVETIMTRRTPVKPVTVPKIQNENVGFESDSNCNSLVKQRKCSIGCVDTW